MPFPNQHAARVRSPAAFQDGSFRTIRRTSHGRPFRIIVGRLKGQSETTTQSFRFPSDKWSASDARTWARRHGARTFEAASAKAAASTVHNTGAVCLSVDSLDTATAVGALQLASDDHGPRRRFVKDILHVGDYRWVKGGKERVLNVTPSLLASLATNFGKMGESGLKVPVTKDHSQKAADAIGQLTDVWVDGDRLMGEHLIEGDANLKLIGQPAVEVSAEIVFDYMLRDGNKIGPALVANTVCQRPVISGQGGFVKVAASTVDGKDGGDVDLQQIEAPVLTLSLVEPDLQDGDDSMNEQLLTLATDTFGLKLEKEADDTAAITALSEAWTAKTKELDELKTKLDDAEAKIKAHKPDKVELSANERYYATDSLNTKLDALVSGGRITPGVAKKAKALLSNDVFLAINEDTKEPGYAALLALFGENDPVQLREQTRAQRGVFTLSEDDPGDDEPNDQTKAANELLHEKVKA